MDYTRLKELKMKLESKDPITRAEKELLDEINSIFGEGVYLIESLNRRNVCSKCQRPLP